MTFYIKPLAMEALVAQAWAAPLSTEQIRQMVAPTFDASHFRRLLLKLQHEGLAESGWGYRKQGDDRLPRRIGRVWSLTQRGGAALPEDRRPERLAVIRQSLLDHDLVVGDLLAALVAQGRETIGGLTLVREVRLDREQPKPKCDAVIVVRSGPAVDAIPWVPSMAAAGDDRLRGWAVEVDRRTEGVAVIREKAAAYQRIWQDPSFYARYGRMPIPLWIVPDTVRADIIMRTWAEVWPAGRWCMTTDAHLPKLRAVEWHAGQQQAIGLLDGWAA